MAAQRAGEDLCALDAQADAIVLDGETHCLRSAAAARRWA